MVKATITEVAQLAGVSIKTVSRVVNREPNVRSATREKVNRAIRELNYRPNQSARNLASHRSRLIALVYDDPSTYDIPSSGYVIEMQSGVLNACRQSNYELLIHPCDYRSGSVSVELAEMVAKGRPAGIVLAAPLSNMQHIVAAITSTQTPFVRLSPGIASTRYSIVETNDFEISAQMTEYLASLGHERIAHIIGDPDHKAVLNRFEGYKEGLARANIRFRKRYAVQGNNSIRSGEECAEKLLSLATRPSAIFAANDDMAAGVMRQARRMGLTVPSDLSVAGCDDIALAQQVYPALTTIRQPLSEMAENAAKLLIDNAQGESLPTVANQIPGVIITRDSTAPAPG